MNFTKWLWTPAAVLALSLGAYAQGTGTAPGDKPGTPKAPEAGKDVDKKDVDEKAMKGTGKLHITIEDREKNLRYHVMPDGRVELRVTENGKPMTYSAATIDEMNTKHPGILNKYGLDTLNIGAGTKETPRGEFKGYDPKSGQSFDEWKRSVESSWFWDRGGSDVVDRSTGFDEYDDWVRRQRLMFREFRELRAPSDLGKEPSGVQFGARFGSVDENYGGHLGINKGEGVVVTNVQPGSAAEKAGLKANDIIIKLNDQPVRDRNLLRGDLGTKDSNLVVIRGGKQINLTVKGTTPGIDDKDLKTVPEKGPDKDMDKGSEKQPR